MPSFNAPAVSVIIPVRNSGRYFRECLDSVTGQTLHNIEIIIIDDASTDGSDAVAEAYAAQDSRITVIHHTECTGAGPARNDGIAIAQGEYIAFMDSDDLYPTTNVLEKLYHTAVEKKANICGGSLYKIDAGGNILDMKVPNQYFEKDGWINYSDYQYDGGFYRFLYRSTFLKENDITFPAYSSFEDPVFFVKAMVTAEQFYVFSLYSYAYRKTHKNIVWTYKRAKEHLSGLQDVILISQFYNLKSLHYLMSKNLLETLNHRVSFILKVILFPKILYTINIINNDILKKENKKNLTRVTSIKLLLSAIKFRACSPRFLKKQ